MKLVIAEGGVVVNVVAPVDTYTLEQQLARSNGVFSEWIVDDAVVVSVGDVFDPKDPQIDAVDVATFRVLFRHENMIRQLVRAVRTNAGINTAATTAGLPTTANSPDLTLTQARSAFKNLIP